MFSFLCKDDSIGKLFLIFFFNVEMVYNTGISLQTGTEKSYLMFLFYRNNDKITVYSYYIGINNELLNTIFFCVPGDRHHYPKKMN